MHRGSVDNLERGLSFCRVRMRDWSGQIWCSAICKAPLHASKLHMLKAELVRLLARGLALLYTTGMLGQIEIV
jgi:hypothetical protein